ncbi:MAG: glutamine-hydrolyzing GMP synthase [Planctomycetaceae bacterium]|nr:glutamine-hydrolyzing GMP synthase [Planctomycetaceae bacterium]
MAYQTVAVLDYGSQYTGLIVRRLREQRVHSALFTGTIKAEELKHLNLAAIVLSGGPNSVYDKDAPKCDPAIFDLGVPVLGICYGAQLMAVTLGGEVGPSGVREYGRATATVIAKTDLTTGLPKTFDVWMSHGDRVVELPPDCIDILATEDCPHGGFYIPDKKFYGLQFHPEVHHTPLGGEILENFLYNVCGCRGDWLMSDFSATAITAARELVGDAKAVMGISGGVDSTVAAVLLAEALGDKLTCIFVDNGLLRKGEFERVMSRYGNRFNIIGVRAGERFLSELKGVTDPEEKRKTIGRVFVEVFQEEARKIDGVAFLGQGTLYPDVIESSGAYGSGKAAVIKSHHNVGGLPEKMGLKLVEPLRELFKDEVRELGVTLGIPEDELRRHPFPGPGLAVRIIGEVTAERVAVLQEVDAIVLEEIHSAGWYRKLWQAFAVLLPQASVGVMGDQRTYESVTALRLVESEDGMTADWAEIPYGIIRRISRRITNEVQGVNRVVYDVSSKPPATIEWE